MKPRLTPAHAAPAVRLFTALWPDTRLRTAVATWQDEWQWPRQAARVKAERLHLTLHFLGDVPARRVAEIAGGLRVPAEPFELALGQGEVWPNGVAVLRPFAIPPALTRLHEALAVALAGLQVPLDARPYKPHVTLARRAHAALPPARGLQLAWPVLDGYVLVRSLPAGGGYEIIERFG